MISNIITHRRHSQRRSLAVVGCAMMGFLLLLGCSEPEQSVEVVRPVRAMKIGATEQLTRREYPGTAKAADEVDLSFRVSGTLLTFPVNVGDKVEKDQIVASLDPRDFEVSLRNIEGQVARARSELAAMEKGARPEDIVKLEAGVERAQSELADAQLDFDRYTELLAANAAAQIDVDHRKLRLDQKKTGLTQAQKELEIGRSGARVEDVSAKKAEIASLEASADATRDQLNYTILKAPFAGTIATKYVDNFQTVQARQPVARLLDSTSIEMVIDIPENVIHLVPRVKSGVVRFEALPNQVIRGVVKEISNEANPATRTYPVTLSMEQPEGAQILPGMAGVARADEVEAVGDEQTGPVIPSSAVFSDVGNKSYVWVVAEPAMTVTKREVQVGELTPLGMRVSGVSAGDWVVTAGVHHLTEGQEVAILNYEMPESVEAVQIPEPAEASQ
jgi:multidrug efflux pump subunit AcrA (membrane-fusion protein)